jgi:hypothetical protein
LTPDRLIGSLFDVLARPFGPAAPKLLFVAAGAALAVATLRACKRGRLGAIGFLLGLAAGLLLAGIGLFPDTFRDLGRIGFLTRIRILMGSVSLLVLAVTFESVRKSHLQERYALLWVATGVMILLCAVFVRVLDFFCTLLGMQYVTFVVAVIFTFLLLVAFHFSIALSGHADDRSKLAQRCALLEERLERLERREGGDSQKPRMNTNQHDGRPRIDAD